MKKILSLLSMLMITVMAFAGSYSDALHFEVNLMGAKAVDLPNGTLTIEKRVDGTYNVTAEGCDFTQYEMGNWGEFVCEEVAGTTDASGLTTIEVSNPYCYLTQSQYTFVNSTLVVKFNETKAYAHFNGTVAFNSFQKYPFQYTFGTDDFGSTGGGGTVETTEGPLVEAGLAPNGAKIEAKDFTINWDTHKVVAKLDLTNCQGVNETIFSFANNAANLGEWNVSNGAVLHFYYTKDADVWTATGWQKLTNTFCIQFRNSDDLDVTPTKYVQVNDPSNVRVELRQDGVYIDGALAFEASDYAKLLTYNDLVFGSTQGENRSNATYKYVEVVGLDWTEPVEVVASKKFTDNIFITQYGTTIPLDLADVTINEMSDGTINMSVVFDNANQTIKSSDLVKDTDEKGRTTYTGTTEVSMMNYDVKAVLYTKDDVEKIFIDMVAANGDKYTVGTDPDYVSPQPKPEIEGFPVDGSVDFAPNGQSFEWTNIPIDWNTQKLVAVIDLSTCGDYTANENILSVGENIGAWKIGGWHFYYTKSAKRMKSDYLTTGGDHPVSDAHDGVEAGTVRIELSKADGCTIDGESFNGLYSGVTGDWKDLTSDFWTTTSINIGSKEGANRSNATIKYVTVVDLENVTPEVTEVSNKDYTSNLRIADAVFGGDIVTMDEATVNITKYSDETYKVTLKQITLNNKTADLVFTGKAPEATEGEGTATTTLNTISCTADEATLEVLGGALDGATFMWKDTDDENITMTFYLIGETFGYEGEFNYKVPATEVSNKDYTSNLRIYDSESESEENLFQADEATVNVVKYSDDTYKITLKQITLNEQTADLVFTGTEQRATPYDEGGTVETEETLIVAQPDAATNEFFGEEEEVGAMFQIVNVSENEIKMALNISGNTFMYDGEFNYDQPEEPKEDYAINFEKDAKQTHSSQIGRAHV